jgi:hypothetical protein
MANCLGVDVSVWQDNNSTPQMYNPYKTRAKGGSFVGIKTSQANWVDPDFIMNWNNCKNVLYEMPYHFLTWDVAPNRQAEVFWSVLEKNIHGGVLPLVADFEWWGTSTPPNAMDMLYNFMERMKALSSPLPLGIYSSLGFWKYNGSTADYWKQFYLWVCDISGVVEPVPPWMNNWTFHQYTFKLNGPEWGAESLDLDGDYYNGTEAEMIARFNLSPLNDMPPVDPPPPTTTKKYFIPTVSNLNMRSDPTTTTSANKVGVATVGGTNLIVDEKDSGGYHWISSECWMATTGYGKIIEK